MQDPQILDELTQNVRGANYLHHLLGKTTEDIFDQDPGAYSTRLQRAFLLGVGVYQVVMEFVDPQLPRFTAPAELRAALTPAVEVARLRMPDQLVETGIDNLDDFAQHAPRLTSTIGEITEPHTDGSRGEVRFALAGASVMRAAHNRGLELL